MKSNVKLRLAIWRSGLSQTEVAFKANVPRSKLSEIVCGWRIPSEEEKIKIASVLGLPVKRLFSKTITM